MKKMWDRPTLLENLSRYGYPLMQPLSSHEPEEVLENLLKQDDVRLLEGFPVVLWSMLKTKEKTTWESPHWHPAEELSLKAQHRFAYLLSLSYYLFRLFGVGKTFEDRVMKLIDKVEWGKQALVNSNKPFMSSETVAVDRVELSTERLKETFRNYATHSDENQNVQKKSHELEVELLLSELFTPLQKDLLRKRLEGKDLSKTEREYFYRVVKKRLKALANDELHQLARRLVA